MTPYQAHKQRWSACQACDLHKDRNRVCLVRGKLPCDILCVGEAPGKSENMMGSPFTGDAGYLLDQLWERGVQQWLELAEEYQQPPRVAITNVVGCVPFDEERELRKPTAKEVKACSPRLQEIIRIAKPAAFVTLGAVAAKYLPKYLPEDCENKPKLDLVHPAHILRMNDAQASLAGQRFVTRLATFLENL